MLATMGQVGIAAGADVRTPLAPDGQLKQPALVGTHIFAAHRLSGLKTAYNCSYNYYATKSCINVTELASDEEKLELGRPFWPVRTCLGRSFAGTGRGDNHVKEDGRRFGRRRNGIFSA